MRTSRERVLKALQLQEPDTVPLMELLIDQKVRDQILPGASYADFIDFMDVDGAVCFDKTVERYETIDATRRVVRDQWGTIKRFSAEALSHPLEPAIRSERDLDGYRPPDPDLGYRYEPLRALVKRFKGHRAVVATITDVFNVCQEIRGSEQHFVDYIENPGLADRLNEIVLQFSLRFIRNCIEAGADIIFITGDYASNRGPMMSPRHFERFILPPLQAMASEVRKGGVFCMKHTDGNIWSIFDMIAASGIHAIDPLEPVAGMDLGEVKRRYGDRLCLMGNVDCGELLSWGTPDQVREEVKNCIRKAARGGGYILASSNSIHSSVDPRNYQEMVRATREYGRYPISV